MGGRELRQQHPRDLLSGAGTSRELPRDVLSSAPVSKAQLSGRPGAGQQITRVLLP